MSNRINIEKWEYVWKQWIILDTLFDSWWHRKWKFICTCGKIFVARVSAVRSWDTISCWCYKAKRFMKYITKHWLCGTYIYSTCQWAMERCNNKSSKKYKNYWWRWINCFWTNIPEMCKRIIENLWHRPSELYTLDRIDNNWNYEPWNIRRATKKQQQNNTRKNVFIEYNWIIKTKAQRASYLWITPETLYQRVKKKWAIEDILQWPIIRKSII